MKVNLDNFGPWIIHDEFKSLIESKGICGTIIAEEDPKFKGWSKDLRVLHIPTGKINSYKAYYDLKLENPVLTIFNGWFQEPLEHELTEFKYIII